jgi:uncharacterized protein YceK
MRITFVVLMLLLLAGCNAKRAPVTPPQAVATTKAPNREYVDVEAGWRLRIIAPITRDGSSISVVANEPAQSDAASRTVTMKASDNLVGYETAFYDVAPRAGGGVQLRLASAEMTRNGVPELIATPAKALLHVAPRTNFIRIFYLIRKSESDHEMAVAGVDRADRLEPFTLQLKANPAGACRTRGHIYCEWIPYGMAVRPELKKTINGVERWADVY